MATLVKFTGIVCIFMVLLTLFGLCFAANPNAGTREPVGLDIKCGEVGVRITAKRQFFEDRRVPFKPQYLRLGAKSAPQSSCEPEKPVSGSEMFISAGLQECGTESHVRGEWLVYSNKLVLFPAVTGTMMVRGQATVIPVECHYKRKQTVIGQPLTPTWMPMTSTISVFGLLHFSLRPMADGCTSLRTSSVYQQGEAVFLEASVEAPLHPPLTVYVDYCVATVKPDPLSLPNYKFVNKYGCLMDSVLPGSSSKFLPKESENRLCFSVQAFRFDHRFGEQMFITCHLRATLKQNSNSHLDKACFFHKPTFSWRAIEGDSALCECCDTDDCFRPGEENRNHTGYTAQSDTEKKHETDTTVGPLRTLPHSHWAGYLSVSHKRDFPA
uniref:Zona pellucida sperm-binding protein 3 n=2 Tax=Anabas testudineus TaxID=64144 RepID=A0A3Q1K3N8_ANATE